MSVYLSFAKRVRRLVRTEGNWVVDQESPHDADRAVVVYMQHRQLLVLLPDNYQQSVDVVQELGQKVHAHTAATLQ